MPGFFISNNKTKISMCEEPCIYQQMDYRDFSFECATLNKFIDDKVFIQDDRYVIILEGVILNKKDLAETYHKRDMKEILLALIDRYGENGISSLRGTFNGMIYDKMTNHCNVYVDHVGDKPVFYYYDNDMFFCGSTMQYMVEGLKKNQIKFSLDEEAVYQELSYGYMVSERTLIREVKRLDAGCILCFDGVNVLVNRYHKFHSDWETLCDWSEDDIIEKLDLLFTDAVRREYEKDHEYGYRHLSALSGGLDSRMNVWIANELGHNDMLNVSFGQSDYLDEKIAKKITHQLGTDLFIKTLDSGKCLLDFKETVRLNNGLSIYFGAAHEYSAFSLLDISKYGLWHTGQLGDVIVGSYYREEKKSIEEGCGAYSKKLSGMVRLQTGEYENEEMFFLYNRLLKGTLNGQLPETYYTEVVSPFLYLEFMEFCLNIPLKYRYDHYIYKKWIMKKHPDAGKISVERFGGDDVFTAYSKNSVISSYLRLLKERGIWFCWKLVLRKVGFKNVNLKDEHKKLSGMNPVDLWYETKPNIREALDNYYEDIFAKSRGLFSSDLERDMQSLYYNGTTLEKCLVLTVLAFIDVFICV